MLSLDACLIEGARLIEGDHVIIGDYLTRNLKIYYKVSRYNGGFI